VTRDGSGFSSNVPMTTASLCGVLLPILSLFLGAQSSRPASRPADGSGFSFYPLGTGASWTWRVTDGGGSAAATRTEEVLRPLRRHGVSAFEVRRTVGIDHSCVYLAASVERVVEYQRGMFTGGMDPRTPPRIRLDCPVAVGKSWDWSEAIRIRGTAAKPMPVQPTWHHHCEIMALDEPVTVPAGTFRAVKVHRTSRQQRYDRTAEQPPDREGTCTTWFAPGVGIVKEVLGPGLRVLELTAFTPPQAVAPALTPAAIARRLDLDPAQTAALRSLSPDAVGGGLQSSFLALDAGDRAELVRVFRDQVARFDATSPADWNRLIEEERLVDPERPDPSAPWSELALAIASLHGVQTGGGRAIWFSTPGHSIRQREDGTREFTVQLQSNSHKNIPRAVKIQLDGARLRSLQVVEE
jgi:hypothetical protein